MKLSQDISLNCDRYKQKNYNFSYTIILQNKYFNSMETGDLLHNSDHYCVNIAWSKDARWQESQKQPNGILVNGILVGAGKMTKLLIQCLSCQIQLQV